MLSGGRALKAFDGDGAELRKHGALEACGALRALSSCAPFVRGALLADAESCQHLMSWLPCAAGRCGFCSSCRTRVSPDADAEAMAIVVPNVWLWASPQAKSGVGPAMECNTGDLDSRCSEDFGNVEGNNALEALRAMEPSRALRACSAVAGQAQGLRR